MGIVSTTSRWALQSGQSTLSPSATSLYTGILAPQSGHIAVSFSFFLLDMVVLPFFGQSPAGYRGIQTGRHRFSAIEESLIGLLGLTYDDASSNDRTLLLFRCLVLFGRLLARGWLFGFLFWFLRHANHLPSVLDSHLVWMHILIIFPMARVRIGQKTRFRGGVFYVK